MPTFVLAHRAPKTYLAPADTATAWNAWFERLGPSLVDRGNPVSARRSLGNCGDETVLGGYTLITAESLDAALALAREDPMLRQGGGVEVGELTLINAGRSALV